MDDLYMIWYYQQSVSQSVQLHCDRWGIQELSEFIRNSDAYGRRIIAVENISVALEIK